MEQTLPTYCNQCENACPREDLRCQEGYQYFQMLETKKAEGLDPLVDLICQCGSLAEYQSDNLRSQGKAESDMLTVLTGEERQQLESLLLKLQTVWVKDMNQLL